MAVISTRRLNEEQCCGCAALDSTKTYDLGLHVAAVFILFAVSAAGALLPAISKKVPFLASRGIIVEWLMSFGFGVVLATRFVHVMNDGIEMLSNPCLGAVVENHESLGMAIVLGSIIVMHVIEVESSVYFSAKGSSVVHGHAHGHGHVHGSDEGSVVVPSSPTALNRTPTDEENPFEAKVQAKASSFSPSSSDTTLNKKLAVVLFEMGVIFHSVIIGIDLGVTSGTGFKTLLVAICFHQFFEGIAVGGSALSALESMQNVMAMNLAYAVTTPLGLVVGIAIRSSYSDTSTTALWVQGSANCVAGGILVYTGVVELLTYQMTTNRDFLTRSGKQRFLLYAAYWMGAGLMALIGKWA